MTITSRDKKLLMILAVALLLFGYYQFILVPQEQRLVDLEARRDSVLAEQERITALIAEKPALETEIAAYDEEMDTMKGYYYGNLEQEELIAMVDHFNPQDVIGFRNYQFTDMTDRTEEIFHEAYGLSMDFVGPYDAIKTFLRRFEAEEKLIAMNSFRLMKDQNGSLTGSINMAFHGLPTLNGYNGTYSTFEIYRSDDAFTGETPFDSFEGYEQATSEPEIVVIEDDGNLGPMPESVIRRTVAGFERQPFFTVPKPETVVAKTSFTGQSYTGAYGLDIAYNFLERMPEASINLVFDGSPVMIDRASERLSLFVYRREATSHPISAVLVDARGNQTEVYFSGEQTVASWAEINAGLPGDLSYPVKVQRLVIHSGGFEGALTGHLVIDSLQTVDSAVE